MGLKRRILVVFTSGTINSGFNEKTKFVRPNEKTYRLLHQYIKKSFREPDVDLVFLQPIGVPGEDSSNIHPGHWIDITMAIAEEIRMGIDGILILFGTDTMAYFSSWLSLCFPYISIPIILTGSQLTLDYQTEDVTVNLTGAFQVVLSEFPGVWIYCNWKLIPGDRAHKSRASHPDMYIANDGKTVDFEPKPPKKEESINSRTRKEYKITEYLKNILETSVQQARKSSAQIRWILCVPGVEPEIPQDKKMICLYGFGAGNAPESVLKSLAASYPQLEKPLIIACSQAERDIKKPEYYENVGIAGLAKNGFKVWGQLDYPIEFIHSLAVFSLLASPNHPEIILSNYLEGPY